jgi:hypothetical protein
MTHFLPVRFPDLTARRRAKWILVTVAGGVVLASGIALVVLPGPAFLVVSVALGILAVEFAWAGRCLDTGRHFAKRRVYAIKRGVGKGGAQMQSRAIHLQ